MSVVEQCALLSMMLRTEFQTGVYGIKMVIKVFCRS